MEKWQFSKYKRPCLCADAINIAEDSKTLLLTYKQLEYYIELDGGDLYMVATKLRQLKNPSSPLWLELDAGADASAWYQLIEQMDYLGLIHDAYRDSASGLTSQKYLAAAKEIADSLFQLFNPSNSNKLTEHLRLISGYCDRIINEIKCEYNLTAEANKTTRVFEAFDTNNFFLQTLMLQMAYQRRNAPLSLVCSKLTLDYLWMNLGSRIEIDFQLIDELAETVYDPVRVNLHLKCLKNFFLRSLESGSDCRCPTNWSPSERLSGINFTLVAENIARENIDLLGPVRILESLSKEDVPLRLLQGCYLEQYHVTSRFVEILTPMMAKSLHKPLKQRMTQYYAEEVGHEVYELESCKSVGIQVEAAESTQPLPLHIAYVDIFTLLSEVEPVGFFISLFVTEGLLGIEPPLDAVLRKATGQGDQYDDISGRHGALNESYHHTSLSRLFMADVSSIGLNTQARAISFMLFLIDLNARSWDDLLFHYEKAEDRIDEHSKVETSPTTVSS
jgi:hypothetical protein